MGSIVSGVEHGLSVPPDCGLVADAPDEIATAAARLPSTFAAAADPTPCSLCRDVAGGPIRDEEDESGLPEQDERRGDRCEGNHESGQPRTDSRCGEVGALSEQVTDAEQQATGIVMKRKGT